MHFDPAGLMKIEQFLSHHGVTSNPFGQEDASIDPVFREHCIDGIRHPAWDKIMGSPRHPATSVVFGEKGSGKTAIRLQIARELEQFNSSVESGRCFIIEYDEFNPFLDCYSECLSQRVRNSDKPLAQWRLCDHIDAMLSLGVTRLVDRVVENPKDVSDGLSRKAICGIDLMGRRNLLLLAAFYDFSRDAPRFQRWNQLRKSLKYFSFKSEWQRALGVLVSVLMIVLVFNAPVRDFLGWGLLVIPLLSWGPWAWKWIRHQFLSRRITRHIRIINHIPAILRRTLGRFDPEHLDGQPYPVKDGGDDRYELLRRFQGILGSLGYDHIVVIVDRVDEPHLINGSPERMRDFLWPLLDNKFLKQEGLALKLLLPSDVGAFVDREEREFYDRSRLDKQNLIRFLEWTGESLYDLATDRLSACSDSESTVSVKQLFDESVTEQELIGAFSRLRVPRHLFKFLHRLLIEHCTRHTDDSPQWTISQDTMRTNLSQYTRDLDAFLQGTGTG
jgi:hypothetical protein